MVCEHGYGHSGYPHACDGCCVRTPLTVEQIIARMTITILDRDLRTISSEVERYPDKIDAPGSIPG